MDSQTFIRYDLPNKLFRYSGPGYYSSGSEVLPTPYILTAHKFNGLISVPTLLLGKMSSCSVRTLLYKTAIYTSFPSIERQFRSNNYKSLPVLQRCTIAGKIYYVERGIMFDEQLNPLLVCTTEYCGSNTKPESLTIRVSSEVLTSRNYLKLKNYLCKVAAEYGKMKANLGYFEGHIGICFCNLSPWIEQVPVPKTNSIIKEEFDKIMKDSGSSILNSIIL